MADRIDRGSDLHTHSDVTDGTASPEAMADAAVAAGLHTWGLSDHVRADSMWLPEYAVRVRAIVRPGLTVQCGIEVKMLDSSGRLDLPAALPELDYVLVADHQYPAADGPTHPREVRRRLDAAETTPAAVVDELIAATCAAVGRAPFRPIVVHLFSLLPKMGLSEAAVHDEHRRALAGACLAAAAAVEVNEKWRCPSAATIFALAEAGVPIVAGSDAHRWADVGAWPYLTSLDSELTAVASR